MKLRLYLTALLTAIALASTSWAATPPSTPPRVIDDDLNRFWATYDAIRNLDDPTQQQAQFQALYVDKGTPGLAAFMQAKGYTAATYVQAIRQYPKYWDSIRPRVPLVRQSLVSLDRHLERFHQLYPQLRPATVYLEIGALRSAGTTLDDKVLLGAEMIAGNANTDTSQMPERLQRFFAGYFASGPLDSLDLLAVHEFVHTQQRGERQTLLAQAVYEGTADFVAERVTGRLPKLAYITYGPSHDAAIKAAFQHDMTGEDFSQWLYNSTENPFGTRDLGYYVGYAICAGYYQKATDKQAALKAMLELDYADPAAVKAFVDASGYFDAMAKPEHRAG
ncbi:DUF2268 domain-containing putative Zn-dependent protease [Dyella sp. 2RAB6]|uniref:DUF2268 domain-containing putative Zn-dependent protease n=1 Tax=Dyella sp. 2RAB6 TaxID=3232992 RepID=UPI003F911714